MIAESKVRGRFSFEMKTDRFKEVEGTALRDDGNFDTLSHVAGLIAGLREDNNKVVQRSPDPPTRQRRNACFLRLCVQNRQVDVWMRMGHVFCSMQLSG